ncbi:glycosyltransferase family 4 protein [Novosphingobium sp. ZN18A2]|uniref:glycosyltransferase family 4 protein n=1 Tax=Novosphingobium sp. ZN18A2 TaxID=3079861 RepID=UPI0030D149AF
MHVSADFPDPFEPNKTPVIRSLLDITADGFDHRAVSINRRNPGGPAFARGLLPRGQETGIAICEQSFDYGTTLQYAAPPRGLFHKTMLHRLGDWLAARLAGAPGPDLLVAHKLTIEGIAVRRAATRLNLPFALVIQGNTDLKILAARPDLRGEFRRIFHDAAAVLPFAPWALRGVEARLGCRAGPVHMMPCPTDLDRPLTPVVGDGTLVSAFHLRNLAGKNLAGLCSALRLTARQGHRLHLSVIGGGSEADLAQGRALAAGLDAVAFEGPLGRAALRDRMHRATGFAMPSHRESFGLVFVEALMAGLPIIYPSGAAVDGWFDGLPFALRVDARDHRAIARAMLALVRDEARLKAELARWQRSDDARRFMRPAIADVFGRGLREAIGRGRSAQA